MLSQKIRTQFLHYFKEKGHSLVPSSAVIPPDDPTLLFINAGMNQFKDVFLGKSVPEYTRAVSAQKCIRVGGKHNDFENVGHTSRHLTFFEMLGNFSFGDYFKKEAIDFAWDFATGHLELHPKKIYATIFYTDEESYELWKSFLPEERIIRMGEKDNFWSMGDVGPCGPCSELHYDRGSAFGAARSPAEDIEGERFIEFWNLVFMESNRDSSGKLTPLPKKSVDTGMGLERVVALKMDVATLFETDILRALIAEVENLTKRTYDAQNFKEAAPFRVIADHVRSLAFAISDGVQPSNIERGYVLRKVLRRAVRYGRTLGLEKPFLAHLLPRLVDMMGEDYPELTASQERIADILTIEEESFLRTLRRGGNMMTQIIEASKKENEISGDDAFKLKDTYGFPLEEIILLAKDADLTVDIRRFEDLESEARDRSRQARKTTEQGVEESLFADYHKRHGPAEFLGYTQLTCEAVILGLMKEGKEVEVLYPGEEGTVLLNQTPFYAEKGGQVGDQGTLSTEDLLFEVTDCQNPYTDVIAHHGVVKKGELHIGNTLTASVDDRRRQKIANNHTATHLLHFALQQVLGEHIKQAGSVVEPERLRFDFYHHKAITPEERRKVEELVNEKIRENRPVETFELSFEEVQKQKEIKQFFGEKYGKRVRMVDIDYSKELCGGTHTSAVGNIGYFKITSEGSIAAGVRRIEALSGEEAEKVTYDLENFTAKLSDLLKVQPGQLLEKIQGLADEKKELTRTVASLKKELFSLEMDSMSDQIETIGGIPCLIRELPLDPKELKECAETMMEKQKSLALFFISKDK
ncbi:MAG: Alanine--tRNA ligase, partial [Chlamydiae bacterium]|nr:Alanine--tRNA ligase [Chlamydiota bacterium]